MADMSYEAFRLLEAANPGLDLAGLSVGIPYGTQAVVTGHARNGCFVGVPPGAAVPLPAPREDVPCAGCGRSGGSHEGWFCALCGHGAGGGKHALDCAWRSGAVVST
jgi:hypothetical protein